jgi:hypothetical protein
MPITLAARAAGVPAGTIAQLTAGSGCIRHPDFPFILKAQQRLELGDQRGTTKLHRDALHFITTSLIEGRERALVAAVPISLSAHCLDPRIEAILLVGRLPS